MDKTSGLYRRMVLVELNHRVEHPDPLFMNKITDLDMEYFLFKAVEGIKLAIEEGRFKIMQSEKQLLELFKRRQSALTEWLYENDICVKDLNGRKCIVLYQQFVEWCNNNGYNKKLTSFTFREDICTAYAMEVRYMSPGEGLPPTQVFSKRGDFDPEFRPF